VWTYYNEDGTIQLTMTYRMGDLVGTDKLNGVFKEYYDDEQLKEEATWLNGEKTGPFTEYRNDGTWVTRDVPPDPALGSGPETERVLEGQTRAREGRYKNGQLDGPVKIYDASGALTRTETYANGELIDTRP
jgi:antitoxin component YwqK of YwqJK toxin-antitoxin module